MNAALFRPGTSDRNIWLNVVEGDEYRLPQMTEYDLCLDIGANTGAATYAMLQKGAGKVIAFEPDPDNFLLFRKQLKHEIKDGRVEIYPLAVVGGQGFSWRTFSGVVQKDGEVNYGGAFLFSEDGSDYGLGEYIVNKPFTVPCIGIESILEKWTADVWKVDCEGGEWEIFRNFNTVRFQTKFKSPYAIMGEYHPHEGVSDSDVDAWFNSEYEVQIAPHPNSDLGLFFAHRR